MGVNNLVSAAINHDYEQFADQYDQVFHQLVEKYKQQVVEQSFADIGLTVNENPSPDEDEDQ